MPACDRVNMWCPWSAKQKKQNKKSNRKIRTAPARPIDPEKRKVKRDSHCPR
jgi:hypothetical protein